MDRGSSSVTVTSSLLGLGWGWAQFGAVSRFWGGVGVRTLERGNFSIFQISSNNISFDGGSVGDAHGTLRFCIRVVLSRKTGVRRAVTYVAYVRVLSREGIFRFFRFPPTTSHSTGNRPAMSATPLVSAAESFLGELGRPLPLPRLKSESV
eukprot:COSAG01_NODE_13001_length_1650_cov_56.836235_1_plen_151_part_00